MKAALYCDLDNMLGYCYSLSYPFIPSVLTDFIRKEGNELTIAKCYGSIDRALPHLENFLGKEQILENLQKAHIEYVSCSGRKNSADLNLSLDALSMAGTYDILYLLSSDSDFLPLVDVLSKQDKKVVVIRMFKPVNCYTNDSIKEVTYPSLLGMKDIGGLDAKVLVYRDILESVLKMSLIGPDSLKEIMNLAWNNFKAGIELTCLAKRIEHKDAFRILKTAFFGRGFMTEKEHREVLLSIRGTGPDDLRSAFYRQCFYILKKNISEEIDEKAMNKTFRLKGEFFSKEEKKLVTC